jgi:hypothetical protein
MNTQFMKTSLVIGLVTGLLFAGGAISPSDAMPVEDNGQAAFRAIYDFGSGVGDEIVELSLISSFQGLYYKYGAEVWTEIVLSGSPGFYSGELNVPTGNDFSEVVFLKTNINNLPAIMTFEGPDGPFWTSLVLDFDPSDILAGLVLVTPSEGDHVAPVPIPASLWILGSGLLILIGLRRKAGH